MSAFYDRNAPGGGGSGDYYDGRGRSRDRDGDHSGNGRPSNWSGGRGGGGGGSRYSAFGRGGGARFREFPKESRYGDSRYGSRRSESRDRASGDAAGPFRGFRDGINSGRPSTYGPDPRRRSNSTASRQNDAPAHTDDPRRSDGNSANERKRDESEQHERDASRAGADRDAPTSVTASLDTKAKRDLLLSARTLPPRPSFHFSSTSSAGGSRASTPKGSQDARDDSSAEDKAVTKAARSPKAAESGEVTATPDDRSADSDDAYSDDEERELGELDDDASHDDDGSVDDASAASPAAAPPAASADVSMATASSKDDHAQPTASIPSASVASPRPAATADSSASPPTGDAVMDDVTSDSSNAQVAGESDAVASAPEQQEAPATTVSGATCAEEESADKSAGDIVMAGDDASESKEDAAPASSSAADDVVMAESKDADAPVAPTQDEEMADAQDEGAGSPPRSPLQQSSSESKAAAPEAAEPSAMPTKAADQEDERSPVESDAREQSARDADNASAPSPPPAQTEATAVHETINAAKSLDDASGPLSSSVESRTRPEEDKAAAAHDATTKRQDATAAVASAVDQTAREDETPETASSSKPAADSSVSVTSSTSASEHTDVSESKEHVSVETLASQSALDKPSPVKATTEASWSSTAPATAKTSEPKQIDGIVKTKAPAETKTPVEIKAPVKTKAPVDKPRAEPAVEATSRDADSNNRHASSASQSVLPVEPELESGEVAPEDAPSAAKASARSRESAKAAVAVPSGVSSSSTAAQSAPAPQADAKVSGRDTDVRAVSRRMSVADERGGHRTASTALHQDRSDAKPRAASFSSTSSFIGHAHGDPSGGRVLQRTHSSSSSSGHYEKRDGDLRQRTLQSEHQRNSPQRSRGSLERRGSFSSDRSERSPPVLAKSRSASGAAWPSAPSLRFASPTPSSGSPGQQTSHESRDEQRRRMRRDELKSSEGVKSESRSSDSDKLKSVRAPLGRSSPQSSAHAERRREPESPREELPALPEIPLPSGVVRPSSLLDDPESGFGTPTKQPKRPRLGWGQGLVASSPTPPQAPKRPRIGWGEGLMQQVASPTSSVVSNTAETPAVAESSSAGADETSEKGDGAMASAEETEAVAATAEDVKMEDASESASADNATEAPTLSQPDATGASLAPPVADVAADEPMAVKDEVVEPAKPSKEAILSSIDTLDSNISSMKRHIKLLQSVILDAETAPAPASEAVAPEAAADASSEAAPADTAAAPTDTSPNDDALTTTSDVAAAQDDKAPAACPAPAKVAVDPAFVQLVASVFHENARKANGANELVPKRLVNGRVATTIYREPSDYPFYQANVDRGVALRESIRRQVRNRNRARYEHLKKLAREYVDLKKTWKLRVKKLEKDRKRQEKLRTKQQLKLKAKQKSAAATGDGSGSLAGSSTGSLGSSGSQILGGSASGSDSLGAGASGAGGSTVIRSSSRLTNNSSADLQSRTDLEKLEQAKAQALIDQEIRKKRLKNALTTVVPDMIVTPEARRARYFVRDGKGQGCLTNGVASDWKQRERAEMLVNPWNDLEKCIYIDKFLQYPKNFARIASFLSNKNTGDVIAFYYRTKKVVDYKACLREQQLRRRGTGSKNTWSCWNLSACAAICLGVTFPEHVARLLLHPSNFRSHQASENIINSAGAQRLLASGAKREETAANSSGSSSGVTGASLVAAGDAGAIAASATGNGDASESKKLSTDAVESERETRDLYSQKLAEFVTGQQQPFLVNFAEFLSDNAFSTGYEVSTLSVAERLKRYRRPVETKAVERAEPAAGAAEKAPSSANSRASAAQDGVTKAKNQAGASSSSAGAKNSAGGTAQLTKKEIKQQRKLKKMQDLAAAPATGAAPTASASGAGPSAAPAAPSSSRKKPAAPPTPSVAAAAAAVNRNSPRVVADEKSAASSSKKSTKSGSATPSARRNSAAQQSAMSSPKVAGSVPSLPLLPVELEPLPVVADNESAYVPFQPSAMAVTPSNMVADADMAAVAGSAAAMALSGAGVSGSGAPAKRVVQKWTEMEKADFLKFFSVRLVSRAISLILVVAVGGKWTHSCVCCGADVRQGLGDADRPHPDEDRGADQELLPEL